jgi:hypothetical protein
LLDGARWLKLVILPTWENDNWRPAWAKSLRDPISINEKLGEVAWACHLNYRGSINRRIPVQSHPGVKMVRPCLKNG